MKRWYFAFLVIIPLLIFLIVQGSRGTDTGFDKSKELTALRKAGHELMLAGGDSTSLILPIREISENEYQLAFEKEFRLEPKLLVDIFRKVYPPSGDYAVEVRNLDKADVIYSFILSRDSTHTVIPCSGRIFPEAHYTITLQLPGTNQPAGYYIAGVLIVLAGVGVWLYKRKARAPHIPVVTTAIKLGKYHFNFEQQKLELNGHVIELTGKEAQLLKIFALSPNMVVERSRLLKEVWEDEGVIVTRSLDMFISKLRKKLEGDPGIKLVNVHGKGYRLDVD